MQSNMIRTIRTVVRKYKTPSNMMARLALDESPEEIGRTNATTARQLLLDLVEDLDDSACVEIAQLMRNLTGDSRGLRRAARDERELGEFRQIDENHEPLPTYMEDKLRGRDTRRMGRDEPPAFPGRPNPGGSMNPLEGEDRRRSLAHDAAPNSFESMFPDAARITWG
jgi:hypothetical protein